MTDAAAHVGSAAWTLREPALGFGVPRGRPSRARRRHGIGRLFDGLGASPAERDARAPHQQIVEVHDVLAPARMPQLAGAVVGQCAAAVLVGDDRFDDVGGDGP